MQHALHPSPISCLNAPYSERRIQADNQFLIAEWFGKKPNSACRKCLRPRFHFRKGSNENYGQARALNNQFILQLQTIHAGIWTSLITQWVSCKRPDFKKASADANWSTAYPRDRMKFVVAQRNESSSSTIAISDTIPNIVAALSIA